MSTRNYESVTIAVDLVFRQLDLPDTVPVRRPQPRKLSTILSLSESFPRLAPPPSPQLPSHSKVGQDGDGSSLNVTAEPILEESMKPRYQVDHSRLEHRPGESTGPQYQVDHSRLEHGPGESRGLQYQVDHSRLEHGPGESRGPQYQVDHGRLKHRPGGGGSLIEESTLTSAIQSQCLESVTVPSSVSYCKSVPQLTSSHPLRDSKSVPPLPSSHPLRNAAIQQEILTMRKEMRKFFKLKLHQR